MTYAVNLLANDSPFLMSATRRMNTLLTKTQEYSDIISKYFIKKDSIDEVIK